MAAAFFSLTIAPPPFANAEERKGSPDQAQDGLAASRRVRCCRSAARCRERTRARRGAGGRGRSDPVQEMQGSARAPERADRPQPGHVREPGRPRVRAARRARRARLHHGRDPDPLLDLVPRLRLAGRALPRMRQPGGLGLHRRLDFRRAHSRAGGVIGTGGGRSVVPSPRTRAAIGPIIAAPGAMPRHIARGS